MSKEITADIEVSELVEMLPSAVHFLREKGIVCILCGEPVWGSLAETAAAKGIGGQELALIVVELNNMLNQ